MHARAPYATHLTSGWCTISTPMLYPTTHMVVTWCGCDLNAAAAVRFSLFNRGGPEGFAASVFPSTMESIVTLAWTPRQLHSHSVRRTCGQVGTEQTQQGALAKRVF